MKLERAAAVAGAEVTRLPVWSVTRQFTCAEVLDSLHDAVRPEPLMGAAPEDRFPRAAAAHLFVAGCVAALRVGCWLARDLDFRRA